MKKVKRKVIATIIRGMNPIEVMCLIKHMKIGGISLHHMRPKIKRIYTVGVIRIGKKDTIVTCDKREPLRRLRAAIRQGCKDLCKRPLGMETFSVMITEDEEPFYA